MGVGRFVGEKKVAGLPRGGVRLGGNSSRRGVGGGGSVGTCAVTKREWNDSGREGRGGEESRKIMGGRGGVWKTLNGFSRLERNVIGKLEKGRRETRKVGKGRSSKRETRACGMCWGERGRWGWGEFRRGRRKNS